MEDTTNNGIDPAYCFDCPNYPKCKESKKGSKDDCKLQKDSDNE